MAQVWLTKSHHNFDSGAMQAPDTRVVDEAWKEWYLVTDELLGRSMLKRDGEPMSSEWEAVYRSALTALTSLDGFVSAVSLGVTDGPKPHIQRAGRDWGYIYHVETGVCVAGFSHRRDGGRPFEGMLGWTEDLAVQKDIDYACIRYGTPDVWRTFFLKRIESNMLARSKKAQEQRAEAQRDADTVMGVGVTLARLAS